MMTVLITGGTGFIGAHLASMLVAEGKKVVLFELNMNYQLIKDIVDRVELIQGDVSNWAEVLDVVSKFEIKEIFHTAALLSDNAEKYPMRAYKVNATGTWHVLEAARQFKVERVMFTSTNGTYGDHIGPLVSNDAPQFPRIMYGVSKIAGERLGEYYYYRYGIDFRGIRFPSVIGPGRGGGGISAYTTLIIQQAALGQPYDIYVNPDTSMPILYIDDAVKALLLLSRTPNEQLSRRVYSLKGLVCSASEIVEEVMRIVPEASLNYVPDPLIVNLIKYIPNMDDSLSQKDWGWKCDYEQLPAMVAKFISELRRRS